METPKIIEPEFAKESFTCPFCTVYAHQTWINSRNLLQKFITFQHNYFLDYRQKIGGYEQQTIKNFLYAFIRNNENRVLLIGEYHIASCHSCKKGSIWLKKEMIYPRTSSNRKPQ